MTSMQGQASAEYAGLLAVAAIIGAALALTAGPPLAHAIRDALAVAISGSAPRAASPVAGAADIADVESALTPVESALSPDAALAALARRHGATEAGAIADALLMQRARAAVPSIGRERTYKAWTHLGDGPYEQSDTPRGDHDVETPTGPPVIAWVTTGEQRHALSLALAHHVSVGEVGLDLVAMVPAGAIGRGALKVGAGDAVRGAMERVPAAAGAGGGTSEVLELFNVADGGVPAGLRAGDIEVAWPVRRTFWRHGRSEVAAEIATVAGDLPVPAAYVHQVILRATSAGLQVVAELGP